MVLNWGILVTVHVSDPAQLLAANEGKVQGTHLMLGVSTDAMFFQTDALVSQDGGGRNYQILVPFDRTINLHAVSGFFQLADASGAVTLRVTGVGGK